MHELEVRMLGRADTSTFVKKVLGHELHWAFVVIKRAEYQRLSVMVTEAEWALYGYVV
jgi:glutamine synthetase